jgi:hypothetical protein
MTQAFHDYFRRPEDLASFATNGTRGRTPSFFHFGEDLVCYGQTSLSDGDSGANGLRRNWQKLKGLLIKEFIYYLRMSNEESAQGVLCRPHA